MTRIDDALKALEEVGVVFPLALDGDGNIVDVNGYRVGVWNQGLLVALVNAAAEERAAPATVPAHRPESCAGCTAGWERRGDQVIYDFGIHTMIAPVDERSCMDTCGIYRAHQQRLAREERDGD